MGWEGPITHRQLVAWNEYRCGEGSKPNLNHLYLMQIALEIRRIGYSFAKSPPTLKMGDFELIFKAPEVAKPLTHEQKLEKIALAKAAWRQRLGG